MMNYARLAVPLVACPFCREMFEKEEAERCPVCGIALQAFESLPRSAHAAAEDDDGIPVEPQHEPFRATYLGRGRGAVVLLAVLGIALFFLPWVKLTLPYTASLTGFELARRIGWSWAAGVAWVVLVPTVASRRTIAQLRGARVAAAFLAGIPAVTAGILLALPPHGRLFPIVLTLAWPLWATLATSAVAIVFAVRLGGRLDDIVVTRGTSNGRELH